MRFDRVFAAVAIAIALAVAPSRWALASGAALGAPCSGPSDCASGYCADGVCCGDACTEACRACSVLAGATGPNGTCGPVVDGVDDPKDACSPNKENPCGPLGVCDGAGQCKLPPDKTPCGKSGECLQGVCVSVPRCDGDKTILGALGVLEQCVAYHCSTATNRCLTSCTSNEACLPGYACSVGGRCEQPIPPDDASVDCGVHPGPTSLPGIVAVALLALLRRRGRRSSAA